MTLANLLWKKNNHTNKQTDLSLAVSYCAGVASACHLRLLFSKSFSFYNSWWLLEKMSKRAGSWTGEESSEDAYWASRWHPHPVLAIGHSECTQGWQPLIRYGGRPPWLLVLRLVSLGILWGLSHPRCFSSPIISSNLLNNCVFPL